MHVRSIRSLVLTGLGAALMACSSGTEESQALHIGQYTLTSANGESLPVEIQLTDDCTMSIQSGYLQVIPFDTLTFRLEYRGPAACPEDDILNGQTWIAYYTGYVRVDAHNLLFRIPDLSHLGLDSLNFEVERLSHQRLRTTVPQLPGTSGPPVTLNFEPTDQPDGP